MMQTKGYTPMMWRLRIGNYVINKLACAGIALLLLKLITTVTDDYITNRIISISLEQWIYSVIMIASITSDAVCALIPPLSRTKSLFLLSVWGYVVGSFFTVYGSGSLRFSGVLGIGTLLLFYYGRTILRERYFTSVMLAWLLPIVYLCLFIY